MKVTSTLDGSSSVRVPQPMRANLFTYASFSRFLFDYVVEPGMFNPSSVIRELLTDWLATQKNHN